MPIEFEIDVELPDKYVRRDEIPAQESGPSTAGFNGDALIQTKTPTVKQDFARLMLAMFATSFSGYPLTFSYAGQAEAPQGKADVLEAKGAQNTTMRFFIAQATHLPIRSRGRRRRPCTWRPAAGARRSAGHASVPYDYRDVDGVKWPFCLRRAGRGRDGRGGDPSIVSE